MAASSSTYTTTGKEQVHVVQPNPPRALPIEVNHQFRSMYGLASEIVIDPRPYPPTGPAMVAWLSNRARRHLQISMELDAIEMAERYNMRANGSPHYTDLDVSNFLRMIEETTETEEDVYDDELPTMAE